MNGSASNFKNDFFKGTSPSVRLINITAPAGFIRHDKKLQEDGLYMAASYLLATAVTQT